MHVPTVEMGVVYYCLSTSANTTVTINRCICRFTVWKYNAMYRPQSLEREKSSSSCLGLWGEPVCSTSRGEGVCVEQVYKAMINWHEFLMDIRTLGMLILQCNLKTNTLSIKNFILNDSIQKPSHLRCINVKWGLCIMIMLLTSVLQEWEELDSCLGLWGEPVCSTSRGEGVCWT